MSIDAPGTAPRSGPSKHPHRRGHSRERLLVMLIGAVAVGVVVGLAWSPLYAPLCGWAVGCLVYLIWVWATIWPMDSRRTASHAVREDPGRRVVDAVLLLCAISVEIDLVVVLWASRGTSAENRWIALLGLTSVVLTWALAQTLFALRYAHLYHSLGGGIDFNRDGYKPTYKDFAYFSFNLGMTFQVSDTTVSEPAIRVTVLRHTLLSYMFTTLVLANVINVVVGILP